MTCVLPGRAAIRDDTIQRLLAGVELVDGRIYSARVWPMTPEGLPALLVYVFRERKALLTLGGTVPQYRVTGTLAVHCMAEAETEAEVEGLLDLLAGTVEATLLLDEDWVAQFEAIPEISTELAVKSTGDRPDGEAVLSFSLQWTESFDPPLPYALRTVAIQATASDPAGATIGATLSITTP